MKLTRDQFIKEMAKNTEGMTQVGAKANLDTLEESIVKALEDGATEIKLGFATIKLHDRPEREGRNPRNPEEIVTIPAGYTAKIKLAPKIKNIVK